VEKYKFRKYDSKYVNLFNLEKERLFEIVKLFDPNVKVEHIGSTAVPGLGGKGIVDVFVGISKNVFNDKIKFDNIKQALIDNDYDFREKASFPERLFFRKDYTYENLSGNIETKGRVHVHLVEFGVDEWNNVIRFRDVLRGNKSVLEQYVKIKQEAVKYAQGEGEKYREYKKGFIEEIKKKIKD
jgi:GrpB-like predicted nucleotidyltransferase (UPF0157 family)